MLMGVNHEELISLRQQLEDGQMKMKSRLEEEEEAKAALMSRIQRLTKLILVSSKNAIPGCLSNIQNHQRSHSAGEDEKEDVLHEFSLLINGEKQNELTASVNQSGEQKYKRSSSKWSEDFSTADSVFTELTQTGELMSGSKLPVETISMSDQMDLLVEQVRLLAGETAFSTSTLKRLLEQSVDDPESSKTQIENLEREIQEKRKQLMMFELCIIESGEASIASASLVEMQLTVTRLMTQCNEKDFELEIKSADNRVLQEQLQDKCAENKVLQEKVNALEQQLASIGGDKSSRHYEPNVSKEYVDGLKKKVRAQELENDKLKLEYVQLSEENNGLSVQNQKLAEEASYAKELASAAAVELKNLASQVTKLSVLNSKLEKELSGARDLAASSANGFDGKFSDGARAGRKGRLGVHTSDDFDAWNLDPGELKMELQARKQREAALQAALAEKGFLEGEYRKKVEEAKRKEEALENDLANMWVVVAKLKKEGAGVPEQNQDERCKDIPNLTTDSKSGENDSNGVLKERLISDLSKPA